MIGAMLAAVAAAGGRRLWCNARVEQVEFYRKNLRDQPGPSQCDRVRPTPAIHFQETEWLLVVVLILLLHRRGC